MTYHSTYLSLLPFPSSSLRHTTFAFIHAYTHILKRFPHHPICSAFNETTMQKRMCHHSVVITVKSIRTEREILPKDARYTKNSTTNCWPIKAINKWSKRNNNLAAGATALLYLKLKLLLNLFYHFATKCFTEKGRKVGKERTRKQSGKKRSR